MHNIDQESKELNKENIARIFIKEGKSSVLENILQKILFLEIRFFL
jgi:hypothetical protein